MSQFQSQYALDNYEIHLTLKSPTPLTDRQVKMGVREIVIENYRDIFRNGSSREFHEYACGIIGRHPTIVDHIWTIDYKTSSRHPFLISTEIDHGINDLWNPRDVELARVKIEVPINHHLVPESWQYHYHDTYYECHISVLNHYLYDKDVFNNLKWQIDGCDRFIGFNTRKMDRTILSYRTKHGHGSKTELTAKSFPEQVGKLLDRQNLPSSVITSIDFEFCWYDSNPSHDDGYLIRN